MSLEKLKDIFSQSLDISKGLVTDDLRYNEIAKWDSIAHMALIAAIEQEFNILMDTDDVIDMSSFLKAREILAKYNVVV